MATTYQGGDDVVVAQFLNPMLRTLERQGIQAQNALKQERAKKDAFDKDIDKIYTSINPTGLRQADMKDFNKNYQDFKDTVFKANTAKNDNERRLLELTIRDKATRLQGLIAQSKEAGNRIFQTTNNVRTNFDKYGDGVNKYLETITQTPTSQMTTEMFDTSPYMIKYDTAKGRDASIKLANNLLKGGEVDTRTSQNIRNIGGRQIAEFQDVTTIRDGAVIQGFNDLYTSDKNFRGLIDEIAQTSGITQQEAVVDYANSLKNQGLLSDIGSKSRVNVTPQRASGSGGDSAGNITIEVGKIVPYGAGNINTLTSLPLRDTKVTINREQNVYDAQTGEKVDLAEGFITGDVAGLYTIPYGDVRVGGVLKKDVPLTPNYVNQNPDKVTWKKKALVSYKEDGEERFVYADVSDVKKGDLSKAKRSAVNAFERTSDQAINQIKSSRGTQNNQRNSVPSPSTPTQNRRRGILD